jgi:hypothetical protein
LLVVGGANLSALYDHPAVGRLIGQPDGRQGP